MIIDNSSAANIPFEILPPSIGYILNAIGQDEYAKSLSIISSNLGVSINSLDTFIRRISSNEPKKIVINSQEVVIPGNILVESNKTTDKPIFRKSYRSAALIKRRPTHPLTMNLMVTTSCSVNRKYCYAQKQFCQELTVNEIIGIIEECHRIGVVNLSLTGGDIFAMNGWKEILLCARRNAYHPFLSTKTPLSYNNILFLSSIDISIFRFSLDSAESQILSSLIGVHNTYLSDVKRMLESCDKIGMSINIRTVLCKQNANLIDVENLYKFLCQFHCVKQWVLTPAFFSEFKDQYKQYEVPNEQLVKINRYIQSLNSTFPIYFNKVSSDGYKLKHCKTVEDFVCHNQVCNANTYSMSILASGDCTICEMLYDNEEYNLVMFALVVLLMFGIAKKH